MSLPIGYTLNKEINRIGFRQQKKPPSSSRVIYDRGEASLLTIASCGSGKGRGNIMPTCLKYRGSLIVLDIKGEAAVVTAKARAKFSRVYIVDPFKKVTDSPAKFNPFDILAGTGSVEQNGTMIAKAFQPEGGTTGDDTYWDNTAHQLLTAACIQALTTDKSFSKMRSLLCVDDVVYKLAVMLDTKQITNRLAVELITGFLPVTDVTRSCILSSVQQHLSIFGDADVLHSLDGPTSFDINELLDGKPITIYFVIPPNKLSAYSTLLRLWFTTMLHLFTERVTRPKLATLFLIDECANLGKVDGLVTAITLLRSYGIRLWLFFQSLGQMKGLYKTDWMTILDNCDCIQAYGFKHYPTAKEMSEIIGTMTPAQLLAMPKEHAVLMRAGHPVEVIKRLDYLKDSLFKNSGFQPNRFYEFERI